MANRMVVIPEEVYDNLVSKTLLQDGLEKRLVDASAGVASALGNTANSADVRYHQYDETQRGKHS